MSKLAFNLPLNSTSLGQVSLLILRELFERKENIYLFPIGNVDLSSQEQNLEFFNWIKTSVESSLKDFKRKNPIFKLWHINGSLESFSDKQVLLTFFEVDSPTQTEINIVDNNKLVLFSSNYAVESFSKTNKNVQYIPLAFDKFNFRKTSPKQKNGIQFGLFGKLEPSRKRHLKTLSLWAQKYGNNPDYVLNCAIFNPFLDPNVQSQMISQALNGVKYWNINFLNFMQPNSMYNDLLNNIDIVLAMSGGEGWGLPEFQSVALGKHCLGVNAHAYKDWMNESNSVLIEPNGKIPVYDNIFFKEGFEFNQGSIYDWSDKDFLEGLEKVVSKFQKSPVNQNGLDLQSKYSSSKFVDNICGILNNI